ncbi:MAG: hybrid sensor histidine kinase/response regulator, partial [Pseudomonadota bacterium]|nr:hybrid sensor histidine kinase/response regulator [Pseudomonadota bacterium]
MSARDLSMMSMFELFRLDAEGQIEALTGGLLALEREGSAAAPLEACMRAAHSLKGAARIVGIDAGVKLTHAMEDCFVAAQLGAVTLQKSQVDILLRGVDLLTRIAATPEADVAVWSGANQGQITEFLAALSSSMVAGESARPESEPAPQPRLPAAAPAVEEREAVERILRVSADNLNRLLGLTAESMVESRWLKPYAESMLQMKRMHQQAVKSLNDLRDLLAEFKSEPRVDAALARAQHQVVECQQQLSERLVQIEMFQGRTTSLAHRLYDAALACRMRPFADGLKAFPRMVRDTGQSLGKQVRLEIVGDTTQVDRDILEKLDAPLGHLLRNAIDHGIESAEGRAAAGKSGEGVIRLEARHSAGLLQITVTDDGRGIDLDKLRAAILERKLTSAEIVHTLSDVELLEFLFLPGFSTKQTVTEISGRGVGLDAVQTMIKQVRGTIRVASQLGQGSSFQLQLPLTLSVVRTLLVEIGGEPYAFPLAQIVRTAKLSTDSVRVLEGRQYFDFDGRAVGLVSAQQLLGGREPTLVSDELAVLIMGDGAHTYGLITDRFLGEQELVVQPLDIRFGKIKDIAAGALMENGLPVLIVDVEDVLQSLEKMVSVNRLNKIERTARTDAKVHKRVLVVDDSLTVRELERKLLDHAGYDVEVAVDGMAGWNALRSGHFDLVVTDIDMPRMDGIELVGLIKR